MKMDFRILALICVVLGGMGQGIVAPKLPELLSGSKHLAIDSGISASLMYLGVFVSTYSWGRLADRGRVHLLFVGGLAAYAVVLVLLGLCSGEAANFTLRFFEGICLSALFVGADFVLGRLSKAEERGQWLSYYGVAMSIGLLLGPGLALFAGRFSSAPVLPLSIAAVIALVLALIVFPRRVQASQHVTPSSLKLNRSALWVGGAYGLMEASLVAVLPVIAIQSFHAVPELCLIAVIVSAAAASIFWGKMTDKKGPKAVIHQLLILLGVGPVLMVLGFQLFSASLMLFACCALFGVLAGGLYPAGFAWLLQSVDESAYGYASGAFSRAYGVGSLVGPIMGGFAAQSAGITGLLILLGALGLLSLGWVKLRAGEGSG